MCASRKDKTMEIGKKYRVKGYPTIYEVIYKHDDGTVVAIYKSGELNCSVTIKKPNFNFYMEYIEPVVHKRYVHWYKAGNTVGTGTFKYRSPQYPGLVHIEEVTWTEPFVEKCGGNCTAAGGQPCGKSGCKQ